jgi:hypothetical protein
MESEMNRKLLLWILGLSGLCLLGCAGLMVGIWGVLTMSTGGEGGGNRQVVLNALAMASHLHDGGPYGYDVVMDSGFPQGALAYWDSVCGPGCGWRQNGNLQCGVFVGMAYGWAGLPLVNVATAIEWWTMAYANNRQPGWIEIPNGGAMPEPGDILIFDSPLFHGEGHAGIVISVSPGVGNHNGSLTFAEANGPSPLVSMPLAAGGTLLVTWARYTAEGFIRHLAPPDGGAGASSGRVVRIDQLDPAQYHTWASSACSAAAMTEVLNAYGGRYRITDVLQVEARLGYITPQEGLTADQGIAATMQQFGFQTTWGGDFSLAQVLAAANED